MRDGGERLGRRAHRPAAVRDDQRVLVWHPSGLDCMRLIVQRANLGIHGLTGYIDGAVWNALVVLVFVAAT